MLATYEPLTASPRELPWLTTPCVIHVARAALKASVLATLQSAWVWLLAQDIAVLQHPTHPARAGDFTARTRVFEPRGAASLEETKLCDLARKAVEQQNCILVFLN